MYYFICHSSMQSWTLFKEMHQHVSPSFVTHICVLLQYPFKSFTSKQTHVYVTRPPSIFVRRHTVRAPVPIPPDQSFLVLPGWPFLGRFPIYFTEGRESPIHLPWRRGGMGPDHPSTSLPRDFSATRQTNMTENITFPCTNNNKQ